MRKLFAVSIILVVLLSVFAVRNVAALPTSKPKIDWAILIAGSDRF